MKQSSDSHSSTSTAASLRPQQDIGNYRLETPLDGGGMGELWKAWCPNRASNVVLKFLPTAAHGSRLENSRVIAAFREANALKHPHICIPQEFGDDPTYGAYHVMRYIEGVTLLEYSRQLRQRQHSVSLADVVRVLKPIAEALDYVHRQDLIHGDVKPPNIIVTGAEGSQLIDFGLVTRIGQGSAESSADSKVVCGTPGYMSPEQWAGQPRDGASDQYSLAVVAYELLSGLLPFEAANDMELAKLVQSVLPAPVSGQPLYVNQALQRALSKRPADRFAGCESFIAALANPAWQATTRPVPRIDDADQLPAAVLRKAQGPDATSATDDGASMGGCDIRGFGCWRRASVGVETTFACAVERTGRTNRGNYAAATGCR